MKQRALIIGLCALFGSSLEHSHPQSSKEAIGKFVRKSNNSISIISIDDAFEEDFPTSDFLKAFTIFKFESRSLVECERFSKPDKYSNVTIPSEPHKFRSTKAFKDFIDHANCLNCDNVFFSSSLHLESVLRCFVNSLSAFLIRLTDTKTTFSDRDLMDLLNRSWTDNGALKVSISINDNVYSFDPFHRNANGMFGKLNPFSGEADAAQLGNLNGYALNVEMFAGTYTFSKLKSPRNVNDFTGPDASAAKFIGEQLNATS